ncbi:MAG: hypothetical protein LBP93_09875 [Treponema sp.]|nr:hypothetical protein [Treponema sp.]
MNGGCAALRKTVPGTTRRGLNRPDKLRWGVAEAVPAGRHGRSGGGADEGGTVSGSGPETAPPSE